MKTPNHPFLAIAALALSALAPVARADGPGPLEIAIGTGFVHGHGPAAGGMMPEVQDLAGSGAAVRGELGWRIDARWLVGAYCEADAFAGGDAGTDRASGGAAGVQGQFHVSPAARVDPWVGVGAGWRVLAVEHDAGTHVLQGLDLARLQVGLDYRVSPRLAVAPSVGVAFTEYLSEKVPGASSFRDLEDRKVGAYVFAGVSGRVDVLGGR
jgi:hypothetical protein